MSYTWKQFVDTVTGMLGVDSDRVGAEQFTPAMIRQGVIQLQSRFEHYRVGHETIYLPHRDLVQEGGASRGVKPPQSVVRDVFIHQPIEDPETGHPTMERYPTDPFPWDSRFALVSGSIPLNSGRGAICPDPQGYTFYAYPALEDGWCLSMTWDGLKLDFKDDEATPFDEQMAGAVAVFVKAQLAREVEKDLALHESYMKSFALAMRQIFVNLREQTQGKL